MKDIVIPPEGYYAPYFTWNEFNLSTKLYLTKNNLSVRALEGNNFKSVYGTFIFKGPLKYYFEIVVDCGQLVKIGVSRTDLSSEEAFCDSNKGWGIYNGELRHGSNSTGLKYGSSLRPDDVIGVLLDMEEGTLSFTRNNESWGVAFKSEELKQGEFVAACSLFCSTDSISLNMMVLED